MHKFKKIRKKSYYYSNLYSTYFFLFDVLNYLIRNSHEICKITKPKTQTQKPEPQTQTLKKTKPRLKPLGFIVNICLTKS
jgi:hypothetical protein